MSQQLAVRVQTQAQANQLMSLAHTHNLRWVGSILKFRVGGVAVFWLYSSNVHYNQVAGDVYPSVLEHVHDSEYCSVNHLAKELAKIV